MESDVCLQWAAQIMARVQRLGQVLAGERTLHHTAVLITPTASAPVLFALAGTLHYADPRTLQ